MLLNNLDDCYDSDDCYQLFLLTLGHTREVEE